MENFFKELDNELKELWETSLSQSEFISEVLTADIAKDLYAIYLTETFHYTSHNTKSQALVATKIQQSTPQNIQYMKFCLKHALEECGHELMAFHDLQKLIGIENFSVEQLSPPLKQTQQLIDRIYEIAAGENYLARLGYSYWAESSYGYFNEPLQALIKKLELKPSMLTFLVAHNDIDVDHFEDIKSIMKKMVKTDQDKDAIRKTMQETLKLTFGMLDGIMEVYKNPALARAQYGFLR